MEVIALLIKEILTWFESLPMQFVLSLVMGLTGYTIKKINQMQKTFVGDINILRLEQAKMREEYTQSAEELKAAINKLSVDLSKELEIQREDITKGYMLALRTAIVNKEFPDSYRLERYDEYKKLKGNSFVDKYVRDNLMKEGE